MKKKPLQCKYGLTIKCAHWDNPTMDRLFTSYTYASPSEIDITAANLICRGCKSFQPLAHTTVVSAILDMKIEPPTPPSQEPADELFAIGIPWPLTVDAQP
jgi:hypothetical protein